MDLAFRFAMRIGSRLFPFSIQLGFFALLILLTATYNFLQPNLARAEALADIRNGDGKVELTSSFVVPNETAFYNFNSSLHGKTGALVAVGTFRFFHDLSQGNFDVGIGFDYNPMALDFNTGLMRLFLNSKNRQEFLAFLFDGETQLIRELEKFERGLISSTKLAAFSSAILARETPRNSYYSLFPETVSTQVIRFFALQMMEFYTNPMARKRSFLGSDFYFDKVKRMIAEKRVFLVHGDLGGSLSLQRMAAMLRKQRIKISVFDISNAFRFIVQRKTGPKNYIDNLKALSFSKDAVVLVTHSAGQRKYSRDLSWNYYSFPIATYVSVAQEFAFKERGKNPFSPSPYSQFIYSRGFRYLAHYDSRLCLFLF